MRTIRRGVFETNSSSVHSLTIMTKKDYDGWTNENYMRNGTIYSFEEAKQEILKDEWFMQYNGHRVRTFTEDDWMDQIYDADFQTKERFGEDYEQFEEYFTTPSGDEMVAFGYYGHD